MSDLPVSPTMRRALRGLLLKGNYARWPMKQIRTKDALAKRQLIEWAPGRGGYVATCVGLIEALRGMSDGERLRFLEVAPIGSTNSGEADGKR